MSKSAHTQEGTHTWLPEMHLGQRKRWEVIDERQGAVSRLPGQDGLFKALWKLVESRPGTHLPQSLSIWRPEAGIFFLSHSPPRTGTPPEPGAQQLARLATNEARICLLPLRLWDPGVFSCSQLVCGQRGPHSGPNSVKAGIFLTDDHPSAAPVKESMSRRIFQQCCSFDLGGKLIIFL